MYNSFTFLHALIMIGSTFDANKSSFAKLNDFKTENPDLFLAKLYVSLNREIAEFWKFFKDTVYSLSIISWI